MNSGGCGKIPGNIGMPCINNKNFISLHRINRKTFISITRILLENTIEFHGLT